MARLLRQYRPGERVRAIETIVYGTGEAWLEGPTMIAVVPSPPPMALMQVDVESIDPLVLESVFQEPGRNEPCHCGSGEKYKKCHLVLDQEAWRIVNRKTRQADAALALLLTLPRTHWPAFEPEED